MGLEDLLGPAWSDPVGTTPEVERLKPTHEVLEPTPESDDDTSPRRSTPALVHKRLKQRIQTNKTTITCSLWFICKWALVVIPLGFMDRITYHFISKLSYLQFI